MAANSSIKKTQSIITGKQSSEASAVPDMSMKKGLSVKVEIEQKDKLLPGYHFGDEEE